MHIERAILIAFIGNFFINDIAGAVVAVLHLGGDQGPTMAQYIVYVVLAAILAAVFAWWYFKALPRGSSLTEGIMLGVVAFIVAIAMAFVDGVARTLMQYGSFGTLATVLPNFFGTQFLLKWQTVALLGYWVVPAGLVGMLLRKPSAGASGAPMPRPMI